MSMCLCKVVAIVVFHMIPSASSVVVRVPISLGSERRDGTAPGGQGEGMYHVRPTDTAFDILSLVWRDWEKNQNKSDWAFFRGESLAPPPYLRLVGAAGEVYCCASWVF